MADEAPVLSIIVISYNTREMTLACLASVQIETRTPFELIVVDNASTDGSAEAIADQFPDVRLLAESTNHGFAPAHDLAVPLARGRWILLLNPDTVVLNGALDKLLAFAEVRPEAGIWGGRTVYGDGSLNPSSCWGRMTPWSTFCRMTGLSGLMPRSEFFNSEAMGDWPRDSVREVDIVTGCLFLMRRVDWEAMGGFDPVFFMYGEEADLCLRARAVGYRPAVTPDATIVHYGAASEKVRADKMVRLLRAKISLIDRHFPRGTRTVGRWMLQAWPLSRALAFRVAAALGGRDDLRETADNWRKIWSRRDEWRNGLGS